MVSSDEIFNEMEFNKSGLYFHPLITIITSKKIVKWILRAYERFLIRRSDAVFVVNDSIGKILAQHYNISQPFTVRNCPELVSSISRNNYLRDTLNISDNRKVLLYHGGFSANRGLHNLVESMVYLPDFTLVMMGYGPLKEELAVYASDMGVDNRVAIIDAVPVNKLINVISSADIGVMPIQGNILSYYLSLPNKIFECLMAGVPVAASNLPEMARIIMDHKVGVTFNPEDPRDIAQVVAATLRDPDYSSMRQRARSAALSVCNWEEEAKVFWNVYKNALDARLGT